MNKLQRLLIIISFLVLGCKNNATKENNFVQKINSLDMNIYSKTGEKIYSIKSPNTNFNKDKNVFNLNRTKIQIYQNKAIKYKIESEKSTLSNNNKLLELTGNVRLNILQNDDDSLYSNKFIWNIDNSQYMLIGGVKFENNSIILISNEAVLNKSNIIEFINPVKYIIKNQDNNRNYKINSDNAFYDINKNSVYFKSNNNRVKSTISY